MYCKLNWHPIPDIFPSCGLMSSCPCSPGTGFGSYATQTKILYFFTKLAKKKGLCGFGRQKSVNSLVETTTKAILCVYIYSIYIIINESTFKIIWKSCTQLQSNYYKHRHLRSTTHTKNIINYLFLHNRAKSLTFCNGFYVFFPFNLST